MMNTKNFLSISLLLFSFVCYAQKNDSKGVTYDWDTSYLRKIVPYPNFMKEGAVILDRKVEVKLPEHQKAGDIVNVKNMYITKTERVLINNDSAVHDFTHLVLPEDFDPFLNWTYRKFAYNYYGAYNVTNEYRIMRLAVRIITKDGRIFNPALREKVVVDSVFYDGTPVRRIKHYFNLSPLFVGDEIQIHYKVELPIQNSVGGQNRIVFNDVYPIQNFDLSVSYAQWTKPLITMENGAETSYDTSAYRSHDIDITKFNWKRKNLSAYDFKNPMATIGAVPYVDISLFNENYGLKGYYEEVTESTHESEFKMRACYLNAKLHFEKKFYWYYPFISFKRSEKTREYIESKQTDEMKGYKMFYKDYIDSDTTLKNDYEKMVAIHNTLNTFKALDYNDLNNVEKYGGKFWDDYLVEKKFRIDHVLDIYSNLNFRLDSSFFGVLLTDKRFKRFNPEMAARQIPHFYTYAFYLNNSFYYLLPKTKYTSYNVNELPFYMENQLALHIPENVEPPVDCDDYNRKAHFIYQKTPASGATDNYRQIIGIVNIEVEAKKLSFMGKVALSGQYSTLLRNFYENNVIDPSIHPIYSCRMSDDAILNSIKYTQLKTSTEFPFKTSYSANFSMDNFDKGVGQKGIIDLQKWFHFTHPNSTFINSKSRLFKFEPDFMFSDKFQYQLVFDKPVNIENLADYTIDISNDYGTFHSGLIKKDDTNYAFDVKLVVNKEKVDADQLLDVEQICFAIEKLQNTKLIYTKL